MEALDDLNLNGLKIIQDSNYFKFGIDSVLLSDFSKIKKNRTVVDFGTGNGIIPLLLYGKYENITIKGLELIKELYKLALRNVTLNGLSGSIEIINGDIKDAVKIFGKGKVDYVVSNPPYIKSDGLLNENEFKRIARHELACTVKDIVIQAHGILNESGTLYMIHRANRLADVLFEMREGDLEPKILRFISKNETTPPGLFLVKGVKNARPDLIIQKPLYIYDINNKYTEEIETIYGKR
jgi:tRNA1Val (adenine37-N6)-methyltransferase